MLANLVGAWEWLYLHSVDGDRFEINLLLFDDAVLVADSEEKLCRLVSEFGRVFERKQWRLNVGKSKVMVLEVWKCGSNACDTKWRAVRGSGLF